MKALKNKMGKNGGFTLVEMLIVVAIIAILVAVSIPLVNSSLEKARIATDNANLRAAKAEGAIKFLSDDYDGKTTTYYYDAESGKLEENDTGIDGYSRCMDHSGPSAEYIIVTIDKDSGEVTAQWENGNTTCTK